MLSLSKKSIFPLFESVCVLNGTIQNKRYHEDRFDSAFQTFFGGTPKYALFEDIAVPQHYQIGKVKLRISYGEHAKKETFQRYNEKTIRQLKLVAANNLEYGLKYENRDELNALFALRGAYDDVLLVKNSMITDTSYANIVFFDGAQWHTPANCLLEGTKRAHLLELGSISKTEIHVQDLESFQGFQLINALMSFDPESVTPITNIHQHES